jgi:hypothetical protein
MPALALLPEAEKAFFAPEVEEASFNALLAHVASGGALDVYCELKGLNLGRVWAWLRSNEKRKAEYDAALAAVKQLDQDRILGVLRQIAFGDVRDLVDSKGKMLPLNQLPAGVARLVAGVNKNGLTMNDRQRAIELLAKYTGIDKTVNLTLSLADLNRAATPEDGAAA